MGYEPASPVAGVFMAVVGSLGGLDPVPGTMSRTGGPGERSNDTRREKASLPCCQQVRSTLTRTCCVCAPAQVRFPPHTLRAITIHRMARSAAWFVASKPGHDCVRAAVEKGEQKRPFVFEMMRQAAIRRIPVVFL